MSWSLLLFFCLALFLCLFLRSLASCLALPACQGQLAQLSYSNIISVALVATSLLLWMNY